MKVVCSASSSLQVPAGRGNPPQTTDRHPLHFVTEVQVIWHEGKLSDSPLPSPLSASREGKAGRDSLLVEAVAGNRGAK